MTKKKEQKATLAELVVDNGDNNDEEIVDLDYVEKQGMSKSRFPDLYAGIQQHMDELSNAQQQINRMEAVRERQGRGFLDRLFANPRDTITPAQYRQTVDEIVSGEIATMKALNANVRKAVKYASAEVNHLANYGNYALGEFNASRSKFLAAHDKYVKLQTAVKKLQDDSAGVAYESECSTDRIKAGQNAIRENGRLLNRMYIYAQRGTFMNAENAAVFRREQALRNVTSELQKMGEASTMSLESVEQTRNTAAIMQVMYQTAEVLQASFTALSDVAEMDGLVTTASVNRFMNYATYDANAFGIRMQKHGQDQREASANESKKGIVEEFLDMLAQPISVMPSQNGTYNVANDNEKLGLNRFGKEYKKQTDAIEDI